VGAVKGSRTPSWRADINKRKKVKQQQQMKWEGSNAQLCLWPKVADADVVVEGPSEYGLCGVRHVHLAFECCLRMGAS
jgi:hypothetical protein